MCVKSRIQEFTKRTGLIDQKVQLWDCSGNPKYKVYWKAMAKVRVVLSVGSWAFESSCMKC